MSHFLLTLAGPDRTGIVARTAEVLFKLGCNLEDSAMTRLQGEFAALLIFTAPGKLSALALARALGALRKKGLAVQVRPLARKETRSPAADRPLCLVAVHGADQPGIVYRAAKALERLKVNITDLSTHRTPPAGGTGLGGYILYIEAERPTNLTLETLEDALRRDLHSLGVTLSVKPLETSPL